MEGVPFEYNTEEYNAAKVIPETLENMSKEDLVLTDRILSRLDGGLREEQSHIKDKVTHLQRITKKDIQEYNKYVTMFHRELRLLHELDVRLNKSNGGAYLKRGPANDQEAL